MRVGPIEHFLTADHVRLDKLLAEVETSSPPNADAYAEFRHALLRRIAMEEDVLLDLASDACGGEPLFIARQLLKDHGELASLLMLSPTAALCDTLRMLLARHNALEEGPVGLYATCDALAGADAEAVVDRLRAVPTLYEIH